MLTLLVRGRWRYQCIASQRHFPDFCAKHILQTYVDHPARCFFNEMSKERYEVSETTTAVSCHHLPLAYSRDRPHNFSCPPAGCRKAPVLVVTSRVWWLIRRKKKGLRDKQCQFLTRDKSLSSENKPNCSMTNEYVHINSSLPRDVGHEHGQSKQSIFWLSTFGILVERLSCQHVHFRSDFVTVFYALRLCNGKILFLQILVRFSHRSDGEQNRYWPWDCQWLCPTCKPGHMEGNFRQDAHSYPKPTSAQRLKVTTGHLTRSTKCMKPCMPPMTNVDTKTASNTTMASCHHFWKRKRPLRSEVSCCDQTHVDLQPPLSTCL